VWCWGCLGDDYPLLSVGRKGCCERRGVERQERTKVRHSGARAQTNTRNVKYKPTTDYNAVRDWAGGG